MAENIEILIEETVNNFEIEIKDFSILKLISEDANNAIVLGEDGGLFADNNNQNIISWGEIEGTLSDQTDLQDALDLKANVSELGATAFSNNYNDLENTPTLISNHSELNLDDGTNPHGTTKEDVGLGNVDNTSDLNKPISNATQNALNSKENSSNKVTDLNTPNNTTFPTTQAIINENKKATITVELINSLTTSFYAPNALRINSTALINGSGTIALKVNDVAYTLGNLIIQGAKITVETTTASVYNLIGIYE